MGIRINAMINYNKSLKSYNINVDYSCGCTMINNNSINETTKLNNICFAVSFCIFGGVMMNNIT